MPSKYEDRIIKLPYRGAPTTVEVIREAVIESQHHYIIREMVEEICSDVQSKDHVSEPLAIYYFTCANTRYMRDPRTVELVRAPRVIAEEISQGLRPSLDCDDMAAFILALAASAGCKGRVVTVAFRDMFYNGERQYSHVYAQVQDPRTGQWISLDPVAGPKIGEMQRKAVAVKTWPII